MVVNYLALAGVVVAFGLCMVGGRLEQKRDRLGALLGALGFVLFFNFLPWSPPPPFERSGCGFPWKWWYDPTWRYSPMMEESDFSRIDFVSWKFDAVPGLGDIAVALAVVGVLCLVNELKQHARGNRPLKALH